MRKRKARGLPYEGIYLPATLQRLPAQFFTGTAAGAKNQDSFRHITCDLIFGKLLKNSMNVFIAEAIRPFFPQPHGEKNPG
jgi:hypothetical protein